MALERVYTPEDTAFNSSGFLAQLTELFI